MKTGGDNTENDAGAERHESCVIAVDVGNSRVKWGRFIQGQLVDVVSLPLQASAAYDVQAASWAVNSSPRHGGALVWQWIIASVNPAASEPLVAWILERSLGEVFLLEQPSQLPLRVAVERPESVGIDRLLNAVAVNEFRPPQRSAIIVDAGSAITVDAVSEGGEFLGGTIGVGLGLALRALHEFTYWLPTVTVTAPPPIVGKSTIEAMQSGVFWGAVGSVREQVRRVAQWMNGEPVVYLTGGDAALLLPYLDRPAELAAELTLHGIHITHQAVRLRGS